MPAKIQPTVFIIDNDVPLRASLRFLLESTGLTCEEFDSAEVFLAAIGPERPGCLLLDVRLPGMSGVALQQELAALGHCLPVIVTTGFADVGTAVAMLKRGAFDFFEKPIADQELLDRVQQAIELDARRRRLLAQRDLFAARLARLTAREHEVFQKVVHGKANKVVAIEFGISEKTVEVHRARVMQKLGAGSLAELVRMDLMAQSAIESSLTRGMRLRPVAGRAA